MKFEYNSNLDFDDRVSLVFNEIKSAYPKIDDLSASKASIIAFPINDYVTSDDKFDRLYKILLFLNKNNAEYPRVFNEMFDLFEEGLSDYRYNDIMMEITKYLNGDRKTFPLMSEVMGD